MYTRYLPRSVGLIFLILLVTACATTRITGEWRDDSYTRPLSKILVIGLSASTVFRRVYEDQLVAQLEAHGVTAVSGAAVLPDGAEASQEKIREAMAGKGFDTVLVTRLIDVETQKTYVSTADYIVPPPYYRNFYDYYYRARPVVYRHDYMVTDTIATLETTVYETTGNRLVWVVTSESFNPQRANDLAAELSQFIVDKLAQDGLI